MPAPKNPDFQALGITGPYSGRIYKKATASTVVFDVNMADPFGDGLENWSGRWVKLSARVEDVGFMFQAAGGTVDPDYPVLSVVGTGTGRFSVALAQRDQ